jgi:imidazolonepropionase-like amidohydrolase
MGNTRIVWQIMILAGLAVTGVFGQASLQSQRPPSIALIHGQWFNGKSFEARTVYSVNGRFTSKKPAHLDRTVDLAGTWIVPPFGEGHNHNLGSGVEAWDKTAIQKYLADGVFYVKIQGSPPVTAEVKRRLLIERPDGVDAIFAQGMLTATGGHPIALIDNVLLPRGYFPGYTKETLNGTYYFTIDSEADLQKKWPAVLRLHPDFIKTILLFSEQFEKRKDDPAYFGQKGLDPHLLPSIVAKAHANHLRVSTHVATGSDFQYAVAAGVDEIAHIPSVGEPIAEKDAALAARRRIVVDTTYFHAVPSLIRMHVVKEAVVRATERANLRVLRQQGVLLAIGSDNPNDTSLQEVEYLQGLGVFDNLTLLKMWSETTPRSIFLKRRIGALKDGYEARFLARGGNPLEDLHNVRKIKMRFKQGFPVELQK